MPKITGGCLGGSVRYASDAEPALVAACHCPHATGTMVFVSEAS